MGWAMDTGGLASPLCHRRGTVYIFIPYRALIKVIRLAVIEVIDRMGRLNNLKIYQAGKPGF